MSEVVNYGNMDYANVNQAVIGASGNSGRPLVQALLNRGVTVTAMGRNVDSKPFGDSVDYAAVDMMDSESVKRATEGQGVIYLTTAVPYNAKLWEEQWPTVINNALGAARSHGSKLVFLDNVHGYGFVPGRMTEETPFNPISRKGVVRAQVSRTVQEAMASGAVNATIGRSADFYGLGSSMGVRYFERAAKEARVNWLGRTDVVRSLGYIDDNAEALAVLGNDKRADKQVWHLPTAEARTGDWYIALGATILGRELGVDRLTEQDMLDDAVRTGGPLQETYELMYQYNAPYVVDSTKFERTFGMKPTSYEDGFRRVFNQAIDRALQSAGK